MKTFLDTGALIAAYRGEGQAAQRVLDLLDDPVRQWVTSDFVRLELLPKPTYHRREDEVTFYDAFFAVAQRTALTQGLVDDAFETAARFGLNAVDALHVAAARAAQCEELVTTERKEKPIHRVTGLRIVATG